MKRFLCLFFLFFMLAGCASNTEDKNPVGLQTIDELNSHNTSSVLHYVGNKIYFYEIVMNSTKGSSDLELYEHDLSSGITRQLGRISDFYTTTNSVVSTDKGFAFTVCTYNEDTLIHNLYYCQEGTLINVYSWNANIPMSYIYKVTNEEILLFSPDSIAEEENEYYIYRISRINLNEKTNVEVKSFRYNITAQKGEIVPAVDFYNNMVYVFKNTVQEGKDNYRVCSYNLEGNIVNANDIDISDFLYLEQTSSYDSVYKIECLEDNLFVLQTLNSRIILFKKVGNKFIRLKAPDKLSAFPEGYKIAKYYDDKSGEIYFTNMFNDNLVKFDVSEKEFSELSIAKNSEVSSVSSININSDGDIFIKMDEQFYLSKENEFHFLADSSLLDQEQKEFISSEGCSEEEESDSENMSSAERVEYNLEVITEKRYEKDGSYIEFNDLPENDAETIVCYDLLYRIFGTYYKMNEFEYNVPEIYEEGSDTERQSAYEWIKVNKISTMTFEELKAQECYEELFEQLRVKLRPEMELDDYVKMILDNGCVVVSIQFEDKYTEEYYASLPQNTDGEHEHFWLFVPDENNQLRIFDNTRIYSHFNFYKKEDVPDSLTLNINEKETIALQMEFLKMVI